MNLQSRVVQIGLAVVVILIAVGWYFTRSHIAKGQSYQGTVVQKEFKAKWGQAMKVGHKKGKFYLIVQTDQSEKRRVRVARRVYRQFEEGDALVKREGERYPQPVGKKAHESLSLGELKQMLNGEKTPAGP